MQSGISSPSTLSLGSPAHSAHSQSRFQKMHLESNVFFETTWIGYVTEHHYDLYYKCLRFWQMGTLLWPPKTSSCLWTFPCLLNSLPPQLSSPASSFAPLVCTCSGERFCISPGTPPCFWPSGTLSFLHVRAVLLPMHLNHTTLFATSQCCLIALSDTSPSSSAKGTSPTTGTCWKISCAQKHNLKFDHFDSSSLYFQYSKGPFLVDSNTYIYSIFNAIPLWVIYKS